jgi:hypothetical protein
MDRHELTITFRGICAHFRDTVPGVPHRVVLPDAMTWHPGAFVAPDVPQPAQYVLPPHFAYVYAPEDDTGINAPGIIDGGWIIAGVRLEVANAIDPSLTYSDSNQALGVAEVPHLPNYVRQYRYSDSVVLGGRAMCYFDVFRGTVSNQLDGDALHTVITMTTLGLPRLQITPLAAYNNTQINQSEVHFTDVHVGSTLVVGNSAVSGSDSQFDFLWHMLTDQAGIPLDLPRPPYGYDSTQLSPLDQRATQDQFAKVLNQTSSGVPNIPPSRVADFETGASCSNSQYP